VKIFLAVLTSRSKLGEVYNVYTAKLTNDISQLILKLYKVHLSKNQGRLYVV
jgi:hypothetical protein